MKAHIVAQLFYKDIDLWMLNNKLKLNSGKTEIIVFSSSYRPRPALENLVIASDTVDCSTTAKNIGVMFNNSLLMLLHVTAVCKSFFYIIITAILFTGLTLALLTALI